MLCDNGSSPFPLPAFRERSHRGLARWATVVTSSAKQYRELARECYFMARSLPPGEDRSALLKMAEEWDRLADE
jgi:hypothetical protein